MVNNIDLLMSLCCSDAWPATQSVITHSMIYSEYTFCKYLELELKLKYLSQKNFKYLELELLKIRGQYLELEFQDF